MSIANAAHHSMMGGKALPYKKRLEYISSTGSQYIDTRWVPTKTAMISIRINVLTSAAFDPQIGCIQNNGKPYYSFHWTGHSTGAKLNFYFGNYSDTLYTHILQSTTNIGMGQPVSISFNGGTGAIKIDNYSATARTVNSVPTVPFYLFCRNNRGVPQLYTAANLYGFKIEDNGETIMRLIPVLDLTGEAKMFDEVTQTYPAHYGTFTPGPEI